jgi:hypothetical protein
MERRVQPLMARDTLGYEYTGDDDTSRMPGDEVDDDDIIDRLSRIFKDMPAYTPCLVPEYSAARPPKKVGSCTIVEYSLQKSSRADVVCFLQDDLVKFVSESASPPQLVEVPEEGKPRPRSGEKWAKETTQLSLKTRPRRTMMKKRCRSAFSCGQGLAALDCRTFLSFRIRRLAWRLVCPCRQGSRTTWPGSAWPRS